MGPCAGGDSFGKPIQPDPLYAMIFWMNLKSTASTNASTTLRFTHTSTLPVCNAQTTQTDLDLNQTTGGGDVVRCVVTPNQANVKHQQLYDYTVQCFDSTNAVVPCVGNNWAFSGLAGWIPVATNTGSTAGTHSSVGSTGQLVYTTGTVSCAANLTVDPETEDIDVQPPAASLKLNQTQGFTATCTQNNASTACTGNQWDPYSTLVGSLSGSTINATTYLATVNNITTQLYAVAFGLNPTNPPYDWADITVGTGGGPPNDDPKDGESDYCVIVNSTLYEGVSNPFYVFCKEKDGDIVECSGMGKTPIWIHGAATYSTNPTSLLLTKADDGTTLRAQVGPKEWCDLELDIEPNPYLCIIHS
jgi:hypothetical protein